MFVILDVLSGVSFASGTLSQLAAMDTTVYQSTLSGQCTLAHTRPYR
jgi:hypothetical protein